MNPDIIPMPVALPQNLQGDPAWRAVCGHLLVRAFPNHPNVWQYVDLKNGIATKNKFELFSPAGIFLPL